MRKQVAVLGLGRFGSRVATTLHDAGHDVLAIDMDEKRVQEMAARVTHAVQADATSESVLTELGLSDFEVAVVAMGSAIESSVLCTILLRKIGVTYVIARANHDLHGSILERGTQSRFRCRRYRAEWAELSDRSGELCSKAARNDEEVRWKNQILSVPLLGADQLGCC